MKEMERELMIKVPLAQYDYLIRVDERMKLLEQITRENRFISINECRRIIGVPPVSDEGTEKIKDTPHVIEVLEGSEPIGGG